jgi:hypothetical protein
MNAQWIDRFIVRKNSGYANIYMYVYYLSVYLNGEAAIAVKTPWGRNAVAFESP